MADFFQNNRKEFIISTLHNTLLKGKKSDLLRLITSNFLDTGDKSLVEYYSCVLFPSEKSHDFLLFFMLDICKSPIEACSFYMASSYLKLPSSSDISIVRRFLDRLILMRSVYATLPVYLQRLVGEWKMEAFIEEKSIIEEDRHLLLLSSNPTGKFDFGTSNQGTPIVDGTSILAEDGSHNSSLVEINYGNNSPSIDSSMFQPVGQYEEQNPFISSGSNTSNLSNYIPTSNFPIQNSHSFNGELTNNVQTISPSNSRTCMKDLLIESTSNFTKNVIDSNIFINGSYLPSNTELISNDEEFLDAPNISESIWASEFMKGLEISADTVGVNESIRNIQEIDPKDSSSDLKLMPDMDHNLDYIPAININMDHSIMHSEHESEIKNFDENLDSEIDTDLHKMEMVDYLENSAEENNCILQGINDNSGTQFLDNKVKPYNSTFTNDEDIDNQTDTYEDYINFRSNTTDEEIILQNEILSTSHFINENGVVPLNDDQWISHNPSDSVLVMLPSSSDVIVPSSCDIYVPFCGLEREGLELIQTNDEGFDTIDQGQETLSFIVSKPLSFKDTQESTNPFIENKECRNKRKRRAVKKGSSTKESDVKFDKKSRNKNNDPGLVAEVESSHGTPYSLRERPLPPPKIFTFDMTPSKRQNIKEINQIGNNISETITKNTPNQKLPPKSNTNRTKKKSFTKKSPNQRLSLESLLPTIDLKDKEHSNSNQTFNLLSKKIYKNSNPKKYPKQKKVLHDSSILGDKNPQLIPNKPNKSTIMESSSSTPNIHKQASGFKSDRLSNKKRAIQSSKSKNPSISLSSNSNKRRSKSKKKPLPRHVFTISPPPVRGKRRSMFPLQEE